MSVSAKGQTTKKVIRMEVFDQEKTRSFSSKTIPVQAESFEGKVDLRYPRGSDQLHDGELRVFQHNPMKFTLAKKGKYPVQFTFVITQKKIAVLFWITPLERTAPPGKPVQVFFILSAKRAKSQSAKDNTLSTQDSQTNTNTARWTENAGNPVLREIRVLSLSNRT
jgi:hypothetical protein